MNRITSLLLLLLACRAGDAKTILVDQSGQDFIVNLQSLHAKDKQCEVVNCLSKELVSYGAETVRPLLFLLHNFYLIRFCPESLKISKECFLASDKYNWYESERWLWAAKNFVNILL